MDFSNYPDIRQPWESFEECEHRLKNMRRAQEEEELRMHRNLGLVLSMSEMTGIGGRDESYQEFCARTNRERVEVERQRTKQKNKILLLL